MIVKKVHGYVHFEDQPTTLKLIDEAGNCWGIFEKTNLKEANYLKDLLNGRYQSSLMDRDELTKYEK